VTFTNLNQSSFSPQFRAGLKEAKVHLKGAGANPGSHPGTGTGNISDYTDIIKLFAAWAGFFWWNPDDPDPILDAWGSIRGRVWGDFEYSGAWPVEPSYIDEAEWDGLSIMECINKIKEITGFIFFVDSNGGVVWRSPNIWKAGNYVAFNGYQEEFIPLIDEKKVLLDYGVTVDDQNLRSRILVSSKPNEESGILYGEYIPHFATEERIERFTLEDLELLGGQERIMAIADYPFLNQAEVDKFAWLTALWIHWSLRKSRFRIPGMVALEPDDQVRIHERVSSEVYVHYITGISSTMDMNAGTWFMDVDTHWLGEGPSENWIVSRNDLEDSPTLLEWLIKAGHWEDADGEPVETDDWYKPPTVRPSPDPILPPPPDWPEPPGLPPDYPVPPGTPPGAPGPAPPGNPPPPPGGWDDQNRRTSSWAQTNWGRFSTCGDNHSVRRHIVRYQLMAPYRGSLAGQTNSHPGQTSERPIQTHEWAIPVWQALVQLIVEGQINIERAGSYNCRKIKRLDGSYSDTWSQHSWGIAIDLNAYLSGWGYGTAPGSDAAWLGNAAETRIKLGAAWGGNDIRVVRWGGTWSNRDNMHFQIQATPHEIQRYGVRVV
jgi:hypothetical protein